MSIFKNIFWLIFLALLTFSILSDVFDLSGKKAFLRECKIHPWTCQELWNQ